MTYQQRTDRHHLNNGSARTATGSVEEPPTGQWKRYNQSLLTIDKPEEAIDEPKQAIDGSVEPIDGENLEVTQKSVTFADKGRRGMETSHLHCKDTTFL